MAPPRTRSASRYGIRLNSRREVTEARGLGRKDEVTVQQSDEPDKVRVANERLRPLQVIRVFYGRGGSIVKEALELAGFFGAHGIWCVSDGGPLIPMVAYQGRDGKRGSDRFVDQERLERAVERAKESLEANPHHAESSVLVYDGFITLGDWRSDALFLDIRRWGSTGWRLSMALPYRAHDHPSGFAVFRPKFIEYAGPGEPDYGQMGQAFFAGVDSHTEGTKVWTQHLDESH